MAAKIFIHGLESSNKGTKALFFSERFPEMIIPTFTGDLEERMSALASTLSGMSGITLVGSSFGGLMATLFAMSDEERVASMVLLAPALNLLNFSGREVKKISVPVQLYHGKGDEVIPFDIVEQISKEIFLNLSFNAVQDDHFLHRTFKKIDWDCFLSPEPI